MTSPSTAQPGPKPARDFIPAVPSPWLLPLAKVLNNYALQWRNRLHIDPADLAVLKGLPSSSGVILTPNHADEVDPRVCLELSRLSGRPFIFMGNREVFDEMFGLAGWLLQRIGLFSVERGGHDTPAKQYATDVVKQGSAVLVIFPEGEIYYLNEKVQPFHSGAVDIGMRAIIERRQTEPSWTAYVVPMAIKYSYAVPMRAVLEKRVLKMEQQLKLARSGHEMRRRLATILSEVLQREEINYNIETEAAHYTELAERITHARHAILDKVQKKYTAAYSKQAATIDRAFQLSAHVRELLAKKPGPELKAAYQHDLAALKEVAHMVSWQPQYLENDESTERLAEMVLKLERELYRIKRPPQLARRNVVLQIGQPLDLAGFLHAYHEDAYTVRRTVAEELRTTIQSLIDGKATSAGPTS
jgi:1-acyl-sn-glycerol-3-phosphate acyltransferase